MSQHHLFIVQQHHFLATSCCALVGNQYKAFKSSVACFLAVVSVLQVTITVIIDYSADEFFD